MKTTTYPKTMLSPFFNSFPSDFNEKILNDYAGGAEEAERLISQFMEKYFDLDTSTEKIFLEMEKSNSGFYFMCIETGEILFEVDFEEHTLQSDFSDIIPEKFVSDLDFYKIYFRFDKDKFEKFYEEEKKARESLEYPEDEIIETGGFFSGLAYTKEIDGVKHHKVIGDTFFGRMKNAQTPKAVFVNADTGMTEDIFYGSANDFNLYLLVKINKGHRFFLFATEGGENVQIHQFNGFVSDGRKRTNSFGTVDKLCSRVVVRCNRRGEWRLISWEYLD